MQGHTIQVVKDVYFALFRDICFAPQHNLLKGKVIFPKKGKTLFPKKGKPVFPQKVEISSHIYYKGYRIF